MYADREAMIHIAGKEYPLLLTTRATKEIAGRYGGLQNLGDKLMNAENFEMALDEIVWLITVLANQPIMIHNLSDNNNPKPLLTAEQVELLTAPSDLAAFKDAIMQALAKGAMRNIQSEENLKNAADE